jgi:hypothetical protein
MLATLLVTEQNVALGGENIAAMATSIRHFPLSP